jgi:nucleoside-diphosphate-sugar epimerase
MNAATKTATKTAAAAVSDGAADQEPTIVDAKPPNEALATPPAASPGENLFPVRARTARRRLGQPRILLIGCGDIGLRIVARLRDRFRIFGTVTSTASAAAARTAGAIPLLLDLDHGRAEGAQSAQRDARIAGLASRVMVLAPTSAAGRRDRRAQRILRLLSQGRTPASGARLLYISTTGVYGDRQGAWTDETTPPMPANERAFRRLDAERRLRASRWNAAVLRVPGIYAADRLPLERLRAAIPVPFPEHDVYTNHIHADDLARACIAALYRAAPARLYNTIDDTQMWLGEYLDHVADRTGLQRPPRASWEQMRVAAGPQRMSFLSESRRLRNGRMKRELRVRLQYPDITAGLADRRAGAAAQASKSPSTER